MALDTDKLVGSSENDIHAFLEWLLKQQKALNVLDTSCLKLLSIHQLHHEVLSHYPGTLSSTWFVFTTIKLGPSDQRC